MNSNATKINDVLLVTSPEQVRQFVRDELQNLGINIDNAPIESEFITRKQFQEKMRIRSSKTIWSWEKEGKLKPHKFGKFVYYKKSELKEQFPMFY